MGSSASAEAVNFQDTQDPTEAQSQCEKLRNKIQGDWAGTERAEALKELIDVMDEDNCDFVALRPELLQHVKRYLRQDALVEKQPPITTVDDLAAQYPDEVNLASCTNDDMVDGWLGLLNLPLIDRIPPVVFYDSPNCVVCLYLKKNHLCELPPDIGMLRSLRELDISENQLKVLPDELSSCVNLESLVISENELKALPKSIGNLKSLEKLICYKNGLTALPCEIGGCAALKEVNFFNNKFRKVPNEFADLENLQDLNLGGNKLMTICCTKKWTSLERLAISWNNIVKLPENGFGGMHSLKVLQLNRNHLEELPSGCFGGCTKLSQLDASMNRLKSLDGTGIDECAKLNNLNLSSNKITALPSLHKCSEMAILNIGSNALSSVETLGLGQWICTHLHVRARGIRVRMLYEQFTNAPRAR